MECRVLAFSRASIVGAIQPFRTCRFHLPAEVSSVAATRVRWGYDTPMSEGLRITPGALLGSHDDSTSCAGTQGKRDTWSICAEVYEDGTLPTGILWSVRIFRSIDGETL